MNSISGLKRLLLESIMLLFTWLYYSHRVSTKNGHIVPNDGPRLGRTKQQGTTAKKLVKNLYFKMLCRILLYLYQHFGSFTCRLCTHVIYKNGLKWFSSDKFI